MVIAGVDHPLYTEKVVPALQRLLDRFGDGCDWTLESVYCRIMTDEMILVLFEDAFVILEEDGEYLHATIAAAFDGNTEKFFEYTELIGGLAINSGYKGFTFTSQRYGWIKLAKDAGFRLKEVTFAYEGT